MPTSFWQRYKPITSCNTRWWPEIDLWYWLNELFQICTDENYNRIVFNTWIFYKIPTSFNTRYKI